MIKRIAKILTYILTTIIGLLLLLLFLVHQGRFNAYISRVIVEQVNNSISGEIAMEPFSGSLFKEFTLHDVGVYEADSIIIEVNDIHVDYSLPAILRKRLKVDTLDISSIQLHAYQSADSSWNALKVFEPSEPRSPDTTSSGFLREIEIGSFRIASLRMNVNSEFEQEIIPHSLDASIALKFHSQGDEIMVNLKEFMLETVAPDLHVQRFTGNFMLQNNILRWDSLRLALTETDLNSSGTMPLESIIDSEVEMVFRPLAFADIRPFMTGDTLYGSPDIEINYSGEGSRKLVQANIAAKNQKLVIDGWLEGLEDEDSYYLQLSVNEFDGALWTGDSRMKSLITGTMEFEGTGYDIQSNRLDFRAKYDTLRYADYAADSLNVSINKRADNASGELQASTNRGNIITSFSLERIFGRLAYDISSNLEGIDIADFIPERKLYSDLNLVLEAKGAGFDMKTLRTNFILQATNSYISGKPVERFEIALKMNKGAYEIDDVDLQTPFFRLYADGDGDIDSWNNINFQLEPYDLNPLLAPYDIPTVQLGGRIDGNLSGYINSLNLAAELAFDSIVYDSIKAMNFYSSLDVSPFDTSFNGGIDIMSGEILYGDIRADSIHLASEFSNMVFDNNLYLQLNDSVGSDLQFIVETGAVPIIRLPGIKLVLKESVWSGGSDSTFIALGKDTITVNQLALANGSQLVKANGNLAFKGNEDFQLTLHEFDLEELGKFYPLPGDLKGLLSSDIRVMGTAENPEMKGNINVSDPSFQELDFSNLQFDFEYLDELFSVKGNLDDSLQRHLHADLAVPVHISFRDSIYLIEDRDNFSADLRIDSLNTAIFNPYFEANGMRSEGFISSRALVSNTLVQPEIEGGITMEEGNFMYSKAGIEYNDISLESSFSGERITLGGLEIHSGDGSMKVSGYADISLLGDRGLKNLNISIAANNFKALESEKGAAVINSKLELSGPYNGAKVKGQITILESTVNTDAIMAEQGIKTENPNPPLLLQAMQDTILADTITYKRAADSLHKTENNFYDNLSGEFTVRVPGNTWVKGKDMNFELKGELRAIKEGPQVDLFGDLNVNRGFYKFYGKRFSFNKGKVTFTGGREINPQVDFEVVYAFRDEERELRKLKLFLTGRALNPDIRFTLDDIFVEEKDAIAYILFGRRMDNLTTQQTASVEQSAINLTRNLALGQISNVLKDALQSTLQLDVVEINGGENLQSGSVTLGKYITNNLYVRYEQNFAFDKKDKAIEPEEIALEYQIIRSLFLQATNQRENSGFDLIYKKEWK